MKMVWLFIGLLWTAQALLGQGGTMDLPIELRFRGEPLELEQTYQLEDGTPVTVENLRFYLTHFRFFHQGRELSGLGGDAQLVDAADPTSWKVSRLFKNNLLVDSLEFDLGIDSLTNVSGVQGGILDPTNGMYWTWQSGYINLKLEGHSPLCPARKNFFQFHLGGYLQPYSALQRVSLHCPGDGKDWVLVLAVDEILKGIDLRTTYEVMSPGEKAVALSGLVSKAFHVESNGR